LSSSRVVPAKIRPSFQQKSQRSWKTQVCRRSWAARADETLTRRSRSPTPRIVTTARKTTIERGKRKMMAKAPNGMTMTGSVETVNEIATGGHAPLVENGSTAETGTGPDPDPEPGAIGLGPV
jgi:hypothetical protein